MAGNETANVTPALLMTAQAEENQTNNTNMSDSAIPALCYQYQKLCQFRTVMDIFVVAPMCLFGFFGNILSIIVLRRSSSMSTISFLLQALAVADNVYLVACFFFQTLKTFSECTDWWPLFKNIYPLTEPYVWPFASIAQTTAIWLVVLVTVDRYIAISMPLHVHRLCTYRRAKNAVIAIVIAAILYNIPRFLEQKIIYEVDRCLKKKRYFVVHTKFRKDEIYRIVYKTCLFFLFRIVIPMSVLIILNTKLIIVLHRAKRNHAQLTKTNKKGDNFTLILVAVVTVFIICMFPDFILRVVVTMKQFLSLRFDFITISYINTITNMLLTVNSSINCIIYCFTGKRFRKILKHILFKLCITSDVHEASCMNNDTQRYTSLRGFPAKHGEPVTFVTQRETSI